ncbi:DUF2332 domain-containing protein [Sedimentitalea todarodis]|uniref:DUF2332 domain-containing protein n=1 Tax=Sedimentitalea todarodis TaxID=1631240 RepID=A0ABU3VD02_9RHOB|nr:DUF2332 domain-containing protein [Sedimentitalea todarodis]MDU9004057.1 DUF2332 domain-containing protein [Sedimentitalea todarodis]
MTLSDAFLTQAQACAGLGSPFMGRLLNMLASDWPADTALANRCGEWTGDIGPSGASLPLRIAGGLHALVLNGDAPALRAVYPPATVTDARLREAVLDALAGHEAFMLNWIESAPQTNEVGRSAALIAAAHWIAARYRLPFVTSELGASAGLNLMWDRYAVSHADQRLGPADAALCLSPDWSGQMPVAMPVTVAERRGVDLNPLDVQDADQALRLFAYLWPDQPHRMNLTRAAIGALNGTVDKADAIDWLEPRLTSAPVGHIHLIYHTVAWQYFPTEAQARGTALIEAAGARATKTRPLAWLAMENDGDNAGAALTLRLWPEDRRISLGRADFHGRWIRWDA